MANERISDMPGAGALTGAELIYAVRVGDPTPDRQTSTRTMAQLSGSAYSYQQPTTGFNITIPNATDRLILDPGGTLASGTITMPPNPTDGQTVVIYTSQTITTLTLLGNSGQTLLGTITSILASSYVGFYFVAGSVNKWFRAA